MARSLRSQKRQTRLQFNPLSSSSPVKHQYNTAVQDRLAIVGYQGASRTRKPQESHDLSSLPTPGPSSQTKSQRQSSSPRSSSSYASLKLPSQPATYQQRSDNVEDEDDDEILQPSSKRRRLSEKLFQSNIHSSGLNRRSRRLAQDTSPLSEKTKLYQDESDAETPSRKFTRLSRGRSHHLLNAPTLSEDSRETETSQGVATTFSRLGSPETSGDNEDVIVTKPTRRRGNVGIRQDDPFVVQDDAVDYYSSESIGTGKGKREKSSRDRPPGKDEFVVDDNAVQYITSDESGDGQDSSAAVRKGRKSERKTPRRSRQEQEELEEDLIDLQDSEQENDHERARTRGGPVTTQRDKTREHFERLKRQRARKGAPRMTDSDDDTDTVSDDGEGIKDRSKGYEDDADLSGVDIDNIVRGSARIDALSVSSSSPSLIGTPDAGEINEHDDEADENFIVEDSGIVTGRHGRPHADIPLQFTAFASAKPRELFIHIVEWMVKNKISPAFSRDDDVYAMSFSRIDDQVKAQAGSRLISSAWNATFKYAILARPGMSVAALPGLDEDNIRTCDACNRTNHPARYDFRFTGDPYNKDTLEPVEDEDEDEDDEEEGDMDEEDIAKDKASYDEQGHLLASQSTHFYLGRFCAANAEMGHKLTHWKHHLNENVLSYLEEQGVLSAEAIVSRERLNKKKREREAEAIVDTMDETGMIAQLWQGFQDDLEDARFGMEDHVRTGKRGKGRIGSVRA